MRNKTPAVEGWGFVASEGFEPPSPIISLKIQTRATQYVAGPILKLLDVKNTCRYFKSSTLLGKRGSCEIYIREKVTYGFGAGR